MVFGGRTILRSISEASRLLAAAGVVLLSLGNPASAGPAGADLGDALELASPFPSQLMAVN